jgi:hypothetical protein
MGDIDTIEVVEGVFPEVEFRKKGAELVKVQPSVCKELQELREKGPGEKRMLVVGAGENTQFWKRKGACTLDVDPTCNPDLVADANIMSEDLGVQKSGPFDIVLAEIIKFDPHGKDGVTMVNLASQTFDVLGNGGILIIETATFDDTKFLGSAKVPTPKDALSILANIGFVDAAFHRGEVTVVLDAPKPIGDKVSATFYTENYAIFRATKPE